jgi:sugar O-acyltransferase (sialic acid O-acetyltransferase NeuD family)
VSAPLVVIACGGHAREVVDIARAANRASDGHHDWEIVGVVDDRPSEVNLDRLGRLGVTFLGGLEWLGKADADIRYLIGIGDPRVRRDVAYRVAGYGLTAARLVHPAATVGTDVELADGVVVFAGARITTNVTLGRHVHINQNATVGHDTTIGDYVSVNPLAAVSGDCRLESGVLVGTTAAVLQGRTIGADATVGAGACVTRDVVPGLVVKGVPAR